MTRIVVLDGHALNPGDISWDEVASLGEAFTLHPRTEESEILERSLGYDVILTNKTPLGRETLSRLPELKYIGILATGLDLVDVEYAKSRNVAVANAPSYGAASVAQFAFGLLLEITGHVGHHAATVKSGRWKSFPDWCHWDYPLIELDGKTMGIVGFGAIGRRVADLARAFGMRTLAYNGKRIPQDSGGGTEFTSLGEVLEAADVLSLHAPLTDETRGMINRDSIALMKKGAILVNTARGGLIDEGDLAEALKSGKLLAAGLDVLSSEPAADDNPLVALDNCLITPHLAWSPREARIRLMKIAARNIRCYLEGRPENIVNP
ncbi:MAG: D-2-hydroxyacid dehydrogenase [Deltaproteobacteria bacterium]|jgi:glycerate dehydrogenase|nr:D-2-hydroxyacid dehydrogenase [Deltaproteobacteria bacterium]